MNVLQEIGYSFTKLENPELTFEEYWESDEYEGSYDFIAHEIIEPDYHSEWRLESYPEEAKWAKENNLQCFDQEGGGEGGSEYCYMIFSWKDKVYKIEYSYYSHYGHNFEDVESTIREVKPVEKVVTVYEDIK